MFEFHQYVTKMLIKLCINRLKTSNVNVSNGDIKYPIGKIKLCSKFAIKILLCYRCKCWHWKSKVSSYIIWYVFGLYAGKIWIKLYVVWAKNVKSLQLFDRNEIKKKYFWQSATAILQDVSEMKRLFNSKLLIFRILSFSVAKTMVVRLE